MVARRRPEWWGWKLEMSPHVLRRMEDRRFTDLDLRTMLEHPHAVVRNFVPGRWTVTGRLRRRAWAIIVEPDAKLQVVVVITAYPLAE